MMEQRCIGNQPPEEKERGGRAHHDHDGAVSFPRESPQTSAATATSMWHPNEWSYAAEGGKHALFRYSGTDIDFYDHLLRVAKIDLANASSFCSRKEDDDAPSELRTCKIIEFLNEPTSQSFHRQIVQPLLGHCYLDLARLVRLPASCCTQLYDRTLASGSIPPSRLPTWMVDDTKSGNVDVIVLPESVKAALLRDHTSLSPHPRFSTPASSILCKSRSKQNANNTIISVEIKPKAGYITSSPFVLPEHRCKYHRTRYSLQQELMQRGHVKKGWQSKGEEAGKSAPTVFTDAPSVYTDSFVPSNYSPLDLFSKNHTRMQNALQDLSQNMQNNFRVWCNGRQIFGEYENTSDEDCQQILNDILSSSLYGSDDDSSSAESSMQTSDPSSTLLDVITKTVSRVLSRESLLSNMVAMQELDVIDGDGAVLVYERLVHLCDGSNAEAEKALDEAVLTARDGFTIGTQRPPAPTGRAVDYLFASSPYEAPQCKVLDQLLDEIVQFHIHLHSGLQEDGSIKPDEGVMNASHAKCIEYVNELSKEGCIYLLQNWLLSLALCDVSFFVTFRYLLGKEQIAAEAKFERQTCDHGGIALCSMQSEDDAASSVFTRKSSLSVHYEVKIVDCDPKPAKKLRNRSKAESKFSLIL